MILCFNGVFCRFCPLNVTNQFPDIKSKNSLVAKYITKTNWMKLQWQKTETTGFSLAKAIASAVKLDDQKIGIYAGDWDSYKVILFFYL